MTLRVLVVGGGIGGLTAALALRRHGVEARVLERAPAPVEVGAGIVLWPNAMRVLRRLGVAESIEDAGAAIVRGELRAAGGRMLSPTPVREIEALTGERSVALHRADLQRILASAVGDALELGAEVAALDQRGTEVRVVLRDGAERRADAVVGADGLDSAVREALLGPHRPHYAGYTAWRGVAPAAVASGSAFESWGRGRRFGALDLGEGRTYWYATENAPEGGRGAAGLLERFAGWHEPVEALLDATAPEAVLRHDVYDLEPLPRWSVGRATLLGDAAHAMTPDLGQGACQAIEDAWALGECLAGSERLPAALLVYGKSRRARAEGVARQSRWVGRAGQLARPRACRWRDAALRAVPAPARLLSLERLVERGREDDA
jgi:2-polyprenyl-6-methoxyphenol hydroxylase-like FAD-dependent oxidoreductase